MFFIWVAAVSGTINVLYAGTMCMGLGQVHLEIIFEPFLIFFLLKRCCEFRPFFVFLPQGGFQVLLAAYLLLNSIFLITVKQILNKYYKKISFWKYKWEMKKI